jgi:hypothetical protein
MKKFLSVPLLLLFFCCKKQPGQIVPNPFLTNVKGCLKGSVADSDYNNLDFDRGLLSKQKDIWFLRLAFKNKNLENDFLLLQTDSLGNCNNGKIIHLEKGQVNDALFNGKISIQSLNRGQITSSVITDGYVEALHPRRFSGNTITNSLDLLPDPAQVLPEVIVVGYIPASGGISYADYLYLEGLMGFSGNTGSGGSGAGSVPSFGIYSPVSGGGSGAGILPSHDLNINYESSIYKPGIDVAAYMKCFSLVPDPGAQCSVTIFTDLPVNDDPSAFFNWYTGATGHSFLQLTKTNGSQSVTQIVGFTAQKPFQAIGASNPVASKMVDNADHKWNAALTMNITPSQLNSEIQQIRYLSGIMQYSISNYNCVDFALQVINTIRGVNPLIIPKYQIPGQPMSASNTPEGLYKLLDNMKVAGGAEAKNILTDVVLHAGTSHGACN